MNVNKLFLLVVLLLVGCTASTKPVGRQYHINTEISNINGDFNYIKFQFPENIYIESQYDANNFLMAMESIASFTAVAKDQLNKTHGGASDFLRGTISSSFSNGTVNVIKYDMPVIVAIQTREEADIFVKELRDIIADIRHLSNKMPPIKEEVVAPEPVTGN